MTLAPDLELNLLCLLVLLYARSCVPLLASVQIFEFSHTGPILSVSVRGVKCRHTDGILAAANLDELLDICDFGRHVRGVVELTIGSASNVDLLVWQFGSWVVGSLNFGRANWAGITGQAFLSKFGRGGQGST